MHIVFPFHKGALRNAEQWMEWAKELQCGRNHALILMPTVGIDYAKVEELARETFASVEVVFDYEKITGHPQGPNSMMRQAAWHCQTAEIGPWMFCEDDNIPLFTDSFDRWEREYKAFGKDFMGCYRPAHDVTPAYLSGNMMCPKDVLLKASRLGRRVLSNEGVQLAFDIVAAEQILPQAHLTKLLQQEPKNPDGSSITFRDQKSLSLLQPDAVFFHPCKDGSLIQQLREQRGEGTSSGAHNAAPVSATPTPATRTIDFEEYLAIVRERDELLRELNELKGRHLPVATVEPKTPSAASERMKKAWETRRKKEATSAKLKAAWVKRKAEKA